MTPGEGKRDTFLIVIGMTSDKIVERVYARLLRESESNIDLGDIVFSPSRKDGASRDEPNTPEETKLEAELNAWMNFNRTPGEGTLAKLRSLMTGRYSDYFREASSGVVYRGLSRVAVEQLVEWLGTEIDEEVYEGESDVSYVHRPRAGSTATSWSPDIEVAEGFSRWDEDRREGEASVILIAHVSDNPGTFLDVSGIHDTVDWAPPMGESESVALGPVKVRTIMWRRG